MLKRLFRVNRIYFSNLNTYSIDNIKNKKWHLTNNDPSESLYTHKSDAQINISKIPIIKINDDIARCSGGNEILGHPTVYIKVFNHKFSTCKYCGLRFQKN